ncbi:MAG: ExeA family protein [Gemmobacter sp.]
MQTGSRLRHGATGPQARGSSTLDLYTAHFRLAERPFTLLPDPSFLFWSKAHTRAFAILEYGLLTRAPVTLITGEIGAGKTTLLHHLLRTLGDEITVGLVSNAHGDRGELLRWVLLALGQEAPTDATYVDLFGRFQQFLIDEYASGRRVVLIFDEAQNLSRESLEELRMFTNINANKDELLQLVLVGQPELRDTIRRPDLVQFAQRVTASFHLTTMDAETVDAYVRHRMELAGRSDEVFTPAATRAIHAATRGVPRLVNQLCDMALLYAFARNEDVVDLPTIRQVIDDGVFFAGGLMPQPNPADGAQGEIRAGVESS